MVRDVPKLHLSNNFNFFSEALMDLKVILHEWKIQADFGTGLEIGNIHSFLNEALQKEKRKLN